MLDEIVLGSLLAIAAGLTVVAYMYPTVYKELCIPLIGFVATRVLHGIFDGIY